MIARIMKKMIDFSKGNLHDIEHFTKVWAYAREIAELEEMNGEDQLILEIAAIVHDIACPSLREKYGHCEGKLQEIEGPALVEELLDEFSLNDEIVKRVSYLVGHHHTYEGIDGLDYQILIEADYLVNASESHYTIEHIRMMDEKYFKTESGKALLKSMYSL